MSTSVVLPALGESVTEGTVTRWLKNVGDTVHEDEGLLEISTDKVDTEIPSPVSGVVEEILVAEDETVEIGAVLARIGDGTGGAAPEPAAEAAPEQEPAPAPAAPPEPAAQPAAVTTPVLAAPPAAGRGKDVVLPELGESVTEGTVTRWLKQVGDTVQTDEPLLEISTDKVDTEIPSPLTGVLTEILVGEDETVDIGSVLGRIGDAAAATPVAASQPATPVPAPAPAATPTAPAPVAPTVSAPVVPTVSAPVAASAPTTPAPAPSAPAPSTQTPSTQAPLTQEHADEGVYVTPLVRRLARQQGVDLATVHGTGVGGRIRKEDVLRAGAEAAAAPVAVAPTAAPAIVSPLRGTTRPMTRLRAVMAERAVESAQQTARLAAIVEVDVTDVIGRETMTGAVFPACVLAAAQALQAHPTLNAVVDGVTVVYPSTENVSVAVDTDRGELAPVVHDVTSKSVADLTRELTELTARSHDGHLTPDELAGGTFTVTDAGAHGSLIDLPLVTLPQTAALAVGAVAKRPGVVTVDGRDAIAVRSYVYLGLSYDHRIVDGAEAARFLQAVKSRVESATA